MLLDQIQNELISAMKTRDTIRVDTLRYLIAGIKRYQIDAYPPGSSGSLTDSEVIIIIQKQVKTHKESIEAFISAKREDLVKKERAELKILSGYLPEQMSENDIREIIKRVKTQGSFNFGQTMGYVMKELKGKADGNLVQKIVKEELELSK